MATVLVMFTVGWLRKSEWFMLAHRAKRTWQGALMALRPDIFNLAENGRICTPGWPTTGDGWRGLIETAARRIAEAGERSRRAAAGGGIMRKKGLAFNQFEYIPVFGYILGIENE